MYLGDVMGEETLVLYDATCCTRRASLFLWLEGWPVPGVNRSYSFGIGVREALVKHMPSVGEKKLLVGVVVRRTELCE